MRSRKRRHLHVTDAFVKFPEVKDSVADVQSSDVDATAAIATVEFVQVQPGTPVEACLEYGCGGQTNNGAVLSDRHTLLPLVSVLLCSLLEILFDLIAALPEK